MKIELTEQQRKDLVLAMLRDMTPEERTDLLIEANGDREQLRQQLAKHGIVNFLELSPSTCEWFLAGESEKDRQVLTYCTGNDYYTIWVDADSRHLKTTTFMAALAKHIGEHPGLPIRAFHIYRSVGDTIHVARITALGFSAATDTREYRKHVELAPSE